MADVIPIQRARIEKQEAASHTGCMAAMSALTKARLEGLAALEAQKSATETAALREKVVQFEIDRATVVMRRLLDYVPTSLLREIADEIATEYELMKR